MSGQGGGRRNIKIRAVAMGGGSGHPSSHDVGGNERLMAAMQNQQMTPVSLKEHAQL